MSDAAVVLIGLGNRDRGDDGVGLAVAERVADLAGPDLRVVLREGDPLGLIDEWANAERAIVVDAMRSGAAAGTVRRLDATEEPLTASSSASSHGAGLAEAIELARALGRLPRALTVYGIEAGSTEPGEGLSEACAAAVGAAARAILEEAGAGVTADA